jgi:hypothetical protein
MQPQMRASPKCPQLLHPSRRDRASKLDGDIGVNRHSVIGRFAPSKTVRVDSGNFGRSSRLFRSFCATAGPPGRAIQPLLHKECRAGSSRRSMRLWSQSSTSASTQPTLLAPSRTRLGNWPAASRRATCCGEYKTSSLTCRFDSILIARTPELGSIAMPRW